MRPLLTTDGEANILNEVFDDSVKTAFASSLIDYIKLGPSHTSMGQSWDVATIFRDWKTSLRHMIKNKTPIENLTLDANMDKAIAQFRIEYPTVELTPAFQKKILYATSYLVASMKKSVTGPKIADAFVAVGQHIINAALGAETTSYKIMMTRTMATGISDEEFQLMEELRPLARDEVIRDGRLTDAFLDLNNICSNGGTRRDDLTLCRQHALIVTHADTARRFEEYRARQAQKGNPAPISFASALDQAAKAVAKEDKAKAKKDAATEAKAAELIRFGSLSPAQQAAETAAVKQAKADKKIATADAKRAKEGTIAQQRIFLAENQPQQP